MPEPTQRKVDYPPQHVIVYCPKCRAKLFVWIEDIGLVSHATCCGETIYVSINVD